MRSDSGLVKDSPGLMDRLNQWALRYPWRWARVNLVLGLLIVIGSPNSWIAGALVGVVGYLATGWSMANGPARRLLVRKYGEPPA
jgi:hypothetical protein